MNMFRQYGIKEVADVTLYSIHRKKDGSGEVYYVPALYLDTLKISTTEKSADGTWAEGGLGNGRLIHWDYGKQINVNLEDALCTPASLSMCWGGVLSADWKDTKIDIQSGIAFNKNELKVLPRMEKVMYPRFNSDRETISSMLPHTTDTDNVDTVSKTLIKSSVVDGTIVSGSGIVKDKIYNWKMAIESAVKSIAVIPDRFFDVTGRSYPIDQDRRVAVTNLPTYSNFKSAVVYRINNKTVPDSEDAKIIFIDEVEENETQNPISNEIDNGLSFLTNSLIDYSFNRAITNKFNNKTNDIYDSDSLTEITGISTKEDICAANYLAIVVDNNDDYYALIGKERNNVVYWYLPKTQIVTSQFKGIDMWLRFESLNSLIYFLLTKYEKDISKICAAALEVSDIENRKVSTGITKVIERDDEKARAAAGKLWCYINPKTMQPYDDDYWFNQGEIFYIKSLTMAPKGKELKGKKITVLGDQWPGVYMLVGETYIRDRDTHEDERMQLRFPVCKVKSDHTITLQADGDPTVMNINLEVARPKNGIMMELTSYEVAPKLMKGEDGNFYAVDGSTEVLSE